MTSKKLKAPLIPDRYYHIYNRGNNKERIFFHESDYSSFMHKYKHHVSPYVNTYAYCLLPNHFHFLLKIKPVNEDKPLQTVSNQFRRIFISHTIKINYEQKRSGSLFTKNFQRIEISDQAYLNNVVNYIHKNPVKHGICENFSSYPYSSFLALAGDNRTLVSSDEVYSWFGGKMGFIYYHFNDVLDHKLFNLLNLEGQDKDLFK